MKYIIDIYVVRFRIVRDEVSQAILKAVFSNNLGEKSSYILSGMIFAKAFKSNKSCSILVYFIIVMNYYRYKR